MLLVASLNWNIWSIKNVIIHRLELVNIYGQLTSHKVLFYYYTSIHDILKVIYSEWAKATTEKYILANSRSSVVTKNPKNTQYPIAEPFYHKIMRQRYKSLIRTYYNKTMLLRPPIFPLFLNSRGQVITARCKSQISFSRGAVDWERNVRNQIWHSPYIVTLHPSYF